jgi:phage gpG-like protein
MDVHIEGMADLNKKLISMMRDMETDTAIDAIKAGGHTLEMFIKLNIRKQGLWDTGNLFNSVQVYDAKRSGKGAECSVGSLGVIYARIHEFGGTIKPKRAKMLSWIDKRTGERRFANSVTIPARPYVRPAVDENKQAIIDVMKDTIVASLGKYIE